MKTSFLSACLLISTAIIFSNCSKDDESTPAATNDFSPSTIGSNWTYKNTEGATSDTFKLTAVGTKQINGKNYTIMTTADGDSSFTAKSGNDYYRFQSFPELGVDNFEELYLKDNVDVNSTWTLSQSVTIPGVGQTNLNLNYKIVEKGETRSVLGTSYNDVIHVRLDIVPATLPLALGGGDFYYQKGVGLIESNISVIDPTDPIGGGYSSSQQLISHEIK